MVSMDLPFVADTTAGSPTSRADSTDSDMEWLEELCRMPRQDSTADSQASRSDDEWLEELCCSRPRQDLTAGSQTSRSDDTRTAIDTMMVDSQPRTSAQMVHETLMGELPLGIHSDRLIVDFDATTLQSSWEQQANQHIKDIIQQLGGIVAYKIGITADPAFRMYNPAWGYAPTENYDEMYALFASSPSLCADMERRLITRHKEKQGCRNSAPGGENTPTSSPCYTYVVTVPCGDGIGIQQRWKHKRCA